MSNSLYWKETPKPEDEKLFDLHKSTWYFLKDYFDFEELNDVADITLTHNDLKNLNTILKTAKASSNAELFEDIQSIINGIEKYDSITFLIQG